MIDKKTEKADLERRRFLFTEIGLVLALGLVLVGFEYKSYDKKVVSMGERTVTDIPEEIIQVTQQKIEVAPPPPPPSTTVINIVDNDVQIDNDITIDASIDASTQVEAYVPPVAKEEVIEEVEIFQVVESMPSFPDGGDDGLKKYLAQNIKYPTIARESGIQGTVFVTFVVERDGSVTDVKVLRGIGGGCDEEAIRVVKNMPRWSPGKQRGKAVRVQFNMPIKFTLAG